MTTISAEYLASSTFSMLFARSDAQRQHMMRFCVCGCSLGCGMTLSVASSLAENTFTLLSQYRSIRCYAIFDGPGENRFWEDSDIRQFFYGDTLNGGMSSGFQDSWILPSGLSGRGEGKYDVGQPLATGSSYGLCDQTFRSSFQIEAPMLVQFKASLPRASTTYGYNGIQHDDRFWVKLSNANGTIFAELRAYSEFDPLTGNWKYYVDPSINAMMILQPGDYTLELDLHWDGYGDRGSPSRWRGEIRYDFSLTPCRADVSNDNFVTGDDFDLFVVWFGTGDPAADFNNDGFVTGDDFDLFVIAFIAGC